MNNYTSLGIAFIGAGKVGVSLGRYFSEKQLNLLGFYSQSATEAQDAADFTASQALSLKSVLTHAEIIFISIPDDQIATLADEAAQLARQHNIDIRHKIFCHCSGSLTSDALAPLSQQGASIYSLHPMFAFADKYSTYKKLHLAHFTLEGDKKKRESIKGIVTHCGNSISIINKGNKSAYHLASVNASNFVLALINQSIELLTQCGFSEQDARHALTPLIQNNIDNILANGASNSLTGPVERADIKTVQKHLAILPPNKQQSYALLSEELVHLAQGRENHNTDYSSLTSLLNKYIHTENENRDI